MPRRRACVKTRRPLQEKINQGKAEPGCALEGGHSLVARWVRRRRLGFTGADLNGVERYINQAARYHMVTVSAIGTIARLSMSTRQASMARYDKSLAETICTRVRARTQDPHTIKSTPYHLGHAIVMVRARFAPGGWYRRLPILGLGSSFE